MGKISQPVPCKQGASEPSCKVLSPRVPSLPVPSPVPWCQPLLSSKRAPGAQTSLQTGLQARLEPNINRCEINKL